jgi:hypothetical protein
VASAVCFLSGGVGEEEEEEGGSKEAKDFAEKVKGKMLEVKTWPAPFQDWFKGELKKGEAGIKEIIAKMIDAVRPRPNGRFCTAFACNFTARPVPNMTTLDCVQHSSDKTPGACMVGASEEVKAEVKEILEKSDFGELAKAQYESKASGKGPAADKCFDALIDDVEESLITFLGIPAEGAVQEATDLLVATVQRELVEVVAKTRYARAHAEEVEDEEGKKKKFDVDCGGVGRQPKLGILED